MGDKTLIQWTNRTWNPWQGCEHVSPGCDNCYMFRDMERYGRNPEAVVRSKPPTFNKPLRWQREAAEAGRTDLVFLASWSDFFIKEADEWREDAWAIIRQCPNLIFQILTKRHARIEKNLPADWGEGYENVWLGVSAENAHWWARRVPVLRRIPAHVRFVSYEPALGSVYGLSAEGIDWVIVGGESGPKARDFCVEWIDDVRAICERDGAALFVKQLGAKPYEVVNDNGVIFPRPIHLRDSHGGDWDEWPNESWKVRDFPRAYARPS